MLKFISLLLGAILLCSCGIATGGGVSETSAAAVSADTYDAGEKTSPFEGDAFKDIIAEKQVELGSFSLKANGKEYLLKVVGGEANPDKMSFPVPDGSLYNNFMLRLFDESGTEHLSSLRYHAPVKQAGYPIKKEEFLSSVKVIDFPQNSVLVLSTPDFANDVSVPADKTKKCATYFCGVTADEKLSYIRTPEEGYPPLGIALFVTSDDYEIVGAHTLSYKRDMPQDLQASEDYSPSFGEDEKTVLFTFDFSNLTLTSNVPNSIPF